MELLRQRAALNPARVLVVFAIVVVVGGGGAGAVVACGCETLCTIRRALRSAPGGS